MYDKKVFVAAFVAAAPVGTQGWKARAAARAEAAWRVYLAEAREEEYAAAARVAREKLERERAQPSWFVWELWGSHSYAGVRYGASALYGGAGGSKPPRGTPLMTWEAAASAAERIHSSAASRAARAAWQEFIDG